MMHRSVFIRALAAAALGGLMVAGCAATRAAQQQVFETDLAGSNEVPPVMTGGMGHAEVHYNEGSRTIRWKITHSGLSGPVVAGHFHGPAAPTGSAPPVVPLTGNLNAVPIEGQATLTPEQASQLVGGRWYVNLHTAAHPNGEIRGQLVPKR